MKLLSKYLYREYLKAIIYCMLAFISLFIITDLFGNLAKYLSADTPKHLVFQLYAFQLAVSLEFIVPACLMLSTFYTLWQLTRHNELIAMRATGISLLRIMKPFIVVGICFSLAIAVIKETVTPYAGLWLRRLSESKYKADDFEKAMNRNIRDFPYANTAAHRQWRIDEMSLRRPGRLYGVTVIKEKPDGTRIEKIVADRAEWLDGQWWFYNPVIQKFNKHDHPVDKPYSPVPGENTIVEMPDFYEKPGDFVSAAKRPEFLPSFALLGYLRTHQFLPPEEQARIKVEFHARLAMPWACLIATLFAIPVGAKSSRQSVLTNIFLAIAYLFLFYTLIQFGLILGKKQTLSPWLGAWLSNIVFFVAGIYMTRKII